MATVKLKVRLRTDLGKQGAKRTRAGGSVPAVLYGEQLENRTVMIDVHDLRAALSTASGRNVILQLNVEGEEGTTRAVIREMDREELTGGFRGKGYVKVLERREGIRLAINIAKAGDVVLIAGKGHEDYQIIGRERFPFDDRYEIKEALKNAHGEK